MKKQIIIYILTSLLLIISVLGSENCSTLQTDIFIDIDDEPYIVEKNSFFAILPEAYRTTELSCISYVYRDGNIQQTNPQKTEYSDVKIPIFRKKEETREFFTSQNGVINAYYTYHNLVAETTFVLGVRCSLPNNNELIGEKCITPKYQDLRMVPARGVWVTNNAEMVFILILVILVVVIFLGYLYRKTKRLF